MIDFVYLWPTRYKAWWLTYIFSFRPPTASARCGRFFPHFPEKEAEGQGHPIRARGGGQAWTSLGLVLAEKPAMNSEPSLLLPPFLCYLVKGRAGAKAPLCSHPSSLPKPQPDNGPFFSCCPHSTQGKRIENPLGCVSDSGSLFPGSLPCTNHMIKGALDRPHTVRHSLRSNSCMAQTSVCWKHIPNSLSLVFRKFLIIGQSKKKKSKGRKKKKKKAWTS